MSAPDTLRVQLKRGRSKPFWVGHPWVFSGAIHSVKGAVGETGAPCVVEDERGNVLGAGFYNPHAAIAVRLHQHRRTTDRPFTPRALEQIVAERLPLAIERREGLGLPSDGTDAYRLVNSEGDGLSGLVVDRFGGAVVAQLNSRGVFDARDAVARVLQQSLAPEQLIFNVTDEASRLEAIPAGVERGGAGPVEFVEHGVRYRLDLAAGQKTGFYCDQRENRRRFASRCEGQRVLDLYAYVGGFSLAAARRGARSVVAVDTSGPALDALRGHVELNRFDTRVEPIKGDAINFLKEARGRKQSWDRIVVDPPKFARGRAHLDEALKKYARLNTLALAALAPGGLLLTCSCSQHVGRDAFLRMLTDAGHRLRLSVNVHAVWGQPEDHPFTTVAPEGAYLKAALVSTTPG